MEGEDILWEKPIQRYTWTFSLCALFMLSASESLEVILNRCQNAGTTVITHNQDCTRYTLCLPGQLPATMQCPNGTLFSKDIGICDHQQNVFCDSPKNGSSSNVSSNLTTNVVRQADAKSSQHPRDTLYNYEYLSSVEDTTAPFRSLGGTQFYEIQRFLDGSLRRLQDNSRLHFQNMNYEANRFRGIRRPFSLVQNLLGNSVHGVSMSKSAFRVLLCMKDLKRKFRLRRREMHDLMNRIGSLPKLVKYNPRQAIPDDTRRPLGDDYCPFPQGKGNKCDPLVPYRTLDGSCNNLEQPLWGKGMRAFRRVIEPDYADGIDEPRVGYNGHALPSARLVSSFIFKDIDRTSPVITNMHMTFGQFLDHDIGRTAVTKLLNEQGDMVDIECGESGCESSENEACRPITLPPYDSARQVRPCLMFVRSQQILRDDCRVGPREQLNQVSSYLDASQIYGSSVNESNTIREYIVEDRGRLRVTQNYNRRFRPMLPQQEHKMCRDTSDQIRCFAAGDSRVNEQVGLSSLHTIFHRYHNHLEDRLKKLNPHWDGEVLYQETRRIVVAIWQHIVYNEYLPPTLGPELMGRYGLNLLQSGNFDGYNPKVNVDTLNSFQTAAFRFGHSQIPNMIRMTGQTYQHKRELFYSEVFNRPFEIYNHGKNGVSAIDSILLGQISQPAMNTDPFFAKQITNHLFSEDPPHKPGTDLPALNIQRGRDHGLPGYTRWRSWCGLSVPKNFGDLIHYVDPDIVEQLRKTYRRIEDVDLFAGGMAEHLLKGSLLGSTFGCIIGHQFHSFRAGDRFWYERRDRNVGFTSYQLREIRKMTLGRVMCDTLDAVESIQKYVMLQPLSEALHKYGASEGYLLQHLYRGDKNERRHCSALQNMDMQAWTDRNLNYQGSDHTPQDHSYEGALWPHDIDNQISLDHHNIHESPHYDFDYDKSKNNHF